MTQIDPLNCTGEMRHYNSNY